MGITEMLDELKSKACRDEKLRAELLETRKDAQPLRNAENWDMRSTIWICSLQVKNFMLRCAGAPMAVARTHQCLKARMIFTNYSLQDWSKL